MKECIDKGAGLDPRSWMDHHPGRFVDYHQMFILEQDRHRKRFGLQDDWVRFRFGDRNAVSGTNYLLRSTRRSVQKNVARPDQSLDPCPRKAIYFGGQKKVQALSSVRKSGQDLVSVPFVHGPKFSPASVLSPKYPLFRQLDIGSAREMSRQRLLGDGQKTFQQRARIGRSHQ